MSDQVECLAGKIFYLLFLSSFISLLFWGHTGLSGANLIVLSQKAQVSCFPVKWSGQASKKKRTALPVLPACLCICLSLLGLFKSEANFESRHVLDKVVLNEKSVVFSSLCQGSGTAEGDADRVLLGSKWFSYKLEAAASGPRFLHCPSC